MKIKYCVKDSRRTQILDGLEDLSANPLDYIKKEPCVITLSDKNYIKRTPLAGFEEQKRGGKGRIGSKLKDGDFVKHVLSCTTHDKLLFFTSYGRVFQGMVYQIPESDLNSTGKAIVNGLRLDPGIPEGTVDAYGAAVPARAAERVLNIITFEDFNDRQSIFFATKKGVVKKTILSEYRNVNKNGIRALNFRNDDELVGVELVERDDEMFLVSANGKALHFNGSDVRAMGRTATGVRGMKLSGVTFSVNDVEGGDEPLDEQPSDEDAGDIDEIRALVKVDKSADARLLLIVENGFGVLTKAELYTIHKRGGQGMKSIKTGGRNGKVVFAASVRIGDISKTASEMSAADAAQPSDNSEFAAISNTADSLLVITANGQIIRMSVADIRECGRGSMGVKVVNVSTGDRVISASIMNSAEA